MDRLWTPWRFQYLSQAAQGNDSCVLCAVQESGDDAANLIVHRGPTCFALLNLYPYTSGHLMVVTRRHISLLSDASAEELSEMLQLAQRAQNALAEIYHPDGYNLGMNLGACAGAGVAGHLHLHLLPRWTGDSNFMSVVAETRIMPESLDQTYSKLLPFFKKQSP